MDLPAVLDLGLRLAVLGLVLGAMVVHAYRTRGDRPSEREVAATARTVPVVALARALGAFVALGLFGFALESFTGSGPGLWIPLLVGMPAVGLLRVTVVPLLRDVADAVHPRVVVGTVTDRRRRVERAAGQDGPLGQAAFYVTVVDDAGAIREYRLRREAYRQVARGDQVRVATSGLRGSDTHSLVPLPAPAVAGAGAGPRAR
ncbi:hypothetical protein [Isoptericola sediminis]|uniref:Uncharacterized protein n=1 Tax=Isoptericola sediminis TaxID=2733572 RepID=A0A849K647_9MICO|nr:hypothetical protein [Isoptericola sediminis]NNU26627.1 hypothetical protein [Isoptericola sediminis]